MITSGRKLGANRVFAYKNTAVAEKSIQSAKEDGITIGHTLDAVGATGCINQILTNLPYLLEEQPALLPPWLSTIEGHKSKT